MHLYDSPELYDEVIGRDMDLKLKLYYQKILEGKSIKTIHDCSIGTGNLSLVLSELGYDLSGSDLSCAMLSHAQKKVDERDKPIKLFQSDFRYLNFHLEEKVDCVMSTGNSLAHVDNDEVKKALYAMTSILKDHGYLYFDLRNWDKIMKEKKRFNVFEPLIKENYRVQVTQVWDYPTEQNMVFNLLYTFESDNQIFKREVCSVDYFPIKKDLILSYLAELGFKHIQIFEFGAHQSRAFEVMDWYGLICQKG